MQRCLHGLDREGYAPVCLHTGTLPEPMSMPVSSEGASMSMIGDLSPVTSCFTGLAGASLLPVQLCTL